MTRNEEKDKIAYVHQVSQAANRVFLKKWEEMQENSRFLRLKQYTTKQLEKFDKDKRVPYVLDYINSSINTFQGIQRDRRTEIFYYPVESGDEVKCEVLNAVKDSTLIRNNFTYLESDVFLDGLVQKVGVVGYEWTREKDKNGALKIFRIPPRQVMWDLNAREFDKTDATWMRRHRIFTKRDLIARRPEDEKKINNMSFFRGDDSMFLGLDQSYIQEILDKDMTAVALIEFYERKYEARFFCLNKTSGYIEESYYDTPKGADAAIRAKMQEFEGLSAQMSNAGQMPPPPPEFEVIKDNFPVIVKTELAVDTFFEEKTIDEPFYPMDFYHPYHHDGDWWCPLDIQKDGQRYFNKMFSMADHWISSQSKGLVLVNKRTSKAEKNAVRTAFSTVGGMVEVQDSEAYKFIDSKGPAPQLFTLMSTAQQNLEDNSGGRNFQGKKETSSESGVAVRTRIEQGGLSGFVIYDNLRRMKLQIGQKIAWYLTTYMTAPQVVRIEGEKLVQETMKQLSQDPQGKEWFKSSPTRPGVGFLTINTDKQNTLENLQVDCTVDEARWSISKNQSILQEINASLQSNPLLAKTFPPETMLEFMNLPFSVKQEAAQRMAQLEQRQNELDQLAAVKPPSVSATLADIQKLPPQEQAQFIAKFFGIQIDPNAVGAQQGKEGLLEMLKAKAELSMKQESHDQSLEQSAEKHAQDIQAKGAKTKMDMAAKKVSVLHNLSLKENGDGKE